MIVYIYNIGVDLYNGFNGLRHRINWTYFSVLDGLAHPLYSIMNKQGMKAVITNFGAILISLFVKDKKGKGIQIIYGPQVTVIKSDFEEYVEKVSQ